MKENNRLIGLGLCIYFILTITDRFILEVPDYVYLPAAVIAVVCIVVGVVEIRREKQES